jgi:hypothetical protein
VGKQEVPATIVGLVVSASIVILALIVGEGAPRDDHGVSEWLTTSDESTASDQEPALPDWLTDYNLHVPLVGVFYSPPDRHPRRVGFSESDALMDSLSPGVRVKRPAGRSQTIRCSTAADGNAALEARIFAETVPSDFPACDSEELRQALKDALCTGSFVNPITPEEEGRSP